MFGLLPRPELPNFSEKTGDVALHEEVAHILCEEEDSRIPEQKSTAGPFRSFDVHEDIFRTRPSSLRLLE